MQCPCMHVLSKHAPSTHAPCMHAPSMHAPSMHAPSTHAPSMRSQSMHALPMHHHPCMHCPCAHCPRMHRPCMHHAVGWTDGWLVPHGHAWNVYMELCCMVTHLGGSSHVNRALTSPWTPSFQLRVGRGGREAAPLARFSPLTPTLAHGAPCAGPGQPGVHAQ
eukprot:364847-Chlamydomonas_euryale.AAC.9